MAHGDTGDVACDFYHRWEEDLDLLAALGLNAFRFSIAWPRIQPDGRGAPNQRGIDFYRKLVHGLHSRGITPAITLYHWDLPQALEDAGGWPKREIAERFAEFAQIMASALCDADALWITLNEPLQVAHQGYRIGTHAPGHRDDALAAAATHHLLLGHGFALRALRETLPGAARVGIAIDLHPVRAIGEGAREAAAIADAEQNRLFFEPIVHGTYPRAARPHILPPANLIAPGDMELISAPIDFLGVNYYNPHYVKIDDDEGRPAGRPSKVGPSATDYKPAGAPPHLARLADRAERAARRARRDQRGDASRPSALCDRERLRGRGLHQPATARRRHRRASNTSAGTWRRFTGSAIRAASRCAATSTGRCSTTSNGRRAMTQRFGLVFVDYETQRRVPKRSASFYRQVAQANALAVAGQPDEDARDERRQA